MGRPSKPLITREIATEAALAIIDENGLDDFSLGAVARRLGVKSPSLYYHFKDKSELLEQVVKWILSKAGDPKVGNGDWIERTIDLCVRTRRSLLEHPSAAPLILQFFPRHMMIPAYEYAVESYPDMPELHMAMLEGVEKLTYGSALFEAAARARGLPSMPAVDPNKYPQLAESIALNQLDDEGNFVEALRFFFAGIEARTKAAKKQRGRKKATA